MLLLLFLVGCGSPTERVDALAERHGFAVGSIDAHGFRLRIYRHGRASSGKPLHVYLEGDGRPWRTRTSISPDPTPQRPLALELMARDPNPSLYLGRPCYFGQAQAPGCSARLWTSARYSATTIAAMAAALRQIIDKENIQEIRLIGYSGGGVIAWHLAKRLPEVSHLVTIAANLDLGAWTRHHGYSPLSQSLDPAQNTPLPKRVRHWHLIGIRDTQVPPSLIGNPPGPALQGARIWRVDSDHACCWVAAWQEVLREIAAGGWR
jgi:pimeloyl-ACP methyl ester carboxylesterase